MNRPSSFEHGLAAWLEEGPSSGPDDLLVGAHARARSTRQRPAWWLRLTGGTMETTLRARPAFSVGVTLLLITAALVVALAASALFIAARTGLRLGPDDRMYAQAPIIPTGPEALFAFSSWSAEDSAGDVYVVRADGTDGRRITSDALDDWSPAWSPDGGRIAFYSGDEDSVQLRVASADGLISLADAPGCWNPTSQAPAWSPDGRFIAYVADRDPDDGACDVAFTDVFVVASDGSGEPHRLLAESDTRFSASPAWEGDRIAIRASTDAEAQLVLAQVTDPAQPWGLTAEPIEGAIGPDPVALGWPRWAPDGSSVAVTLPRLDFGYGMATVVDLDGSSPMPLWNGPEEDVIVPDWSPDGTWLSMLVMRRQLSDYGVYGLAFASADGREPRSIETVDLTGNAGPPMISPDGSRVLVRAPRGPMPGDVLVVDTDGHVETTLQAGQWSSMDWQPVVNADNPASEAPEGLPRF
jgi:Tol biopolymer transport system component